VHAIQLVYPAVAYLYETDPAVARASRIALLPGDPILATAHLRRTVRAYAGVDQRQRPVRRTDREAPKAKQPLAVRAAGLGIEFVGAAPLLLGGLWERRAAGTEIRPGAVLERRHRRGAQSPA
jgi:hypothetical protein